jgi:hypothetical protein
MTAITSSKCNKLLPSTGYLPRPRYPNSQSKTKMTMMSSKTSSFYWVVELLTKKRPDMSRRIHVLSHRNLILLEGQKWSESRSSSVSTRSLQTSQGGRNGRRKRKWQYRDRCDLCYPGDCSGSVFPFYRSWCRRWWWHEHHHPSANGSAVISAAKQIRLPVGSLICYLFQCAAAA